MDAPRTDTRRRVRIDLGTLLLQLGSPDGPVPDPWGDDVPDPWAAAVLLAASHASGFVAIATGVHSGQVGVRVRTFAEAPPPPALGEHDEGEEVSCRAAGGAIRLGTVRGLRLLDAGPLAGGDGSGFVRVRCTARGRRPRAGVDGDSGERYLLDLWPAPDAPRESRRVRFRRRSGSAAAP